MTLTREITPSRNVLPLSKVQQYPPAKLVSIWGLKVPFWLYVVPVGHLIYPNNECALSRLKKQHENKLIHSGVLIQLLSLFPF